MTLRLTSTDVAQHYGSEATTFMRATTWARNVVTAAYVMRRRLQRGHGTYDQVLELGDLVDALVWAIRDAEEANASMGAGRVDILVLRWRVEDHAHHLARVLNGSRPL